MVTELLAIILMVVFALFAFAGLPGNVLIAITAVIYGFYTDFSTFSPTATIVFVLVGILSTGLDNIFALVGAKKFGSTKYGVIGAFVGFISVFILGPFGFILGPLIGAFLGELIFARKDVETALQAAIGAVVGVFTGIVAKGAVAVFMVIWFAVAVLL